MLLVIQKIVIKGYGICFDEGSQFGHTMSEGGRTHITNHIINFWSRREF